MDPLDFGVCRLSVVPIRSDHREVAEQTSQLLFGDHYEVLKTSPDKKWLRILVYFDQFEGWLDVRQHHSISREYFNQINLSNYKITTEIASPVLYKKVPITIVMGSIVPISGSELFKLEEQFAFNGESKGLGQRRDAEFVTSIAMKYLSSPYQSGGKSPFGLDHDGLIQMVFKIAGYPLLRQIRQQVHQGKPVSDFKDVRPGDIAFFADRDNRVFHGGIILTDSRIIHVSGQVRIDKITEEGILNPETKVYSHLLHSVRRVLG